MPIIATASTAFVVGAWGVSDGGTGGCGRGRHALIGNGAMTHKEKPIGFKALAIEPASMAVTRTDAEGAKI